MFCLAATAWTNTAFAGDSGDILSRQRLRPSVLTAEHDPIAFDFLSAGEAKKNDRDPSCLPVSIGPVSALDPKPADSWRDRPHYLEFTRGLHPVEDYDANRGLRPREMAILLGNEYGRGSWIARGAITLASMADAAERGSQVPLDQVNYVTARLVGETSNLLGWSHAPDLRLRSEVQTDRVMIGLKTRW